MRCLTILWNFTSNVLERSYKEEEIAMPKVGNKHFSYTKKGRAAANAMAKKTGKKVTKRKKK